jgi:GNAT superfamily N-acetyltransferase
MGLGTHLVQECIRFAKRMGYNKLTLWTNDILVEAGRIYTKVGFQLVDTEHHNSFGPELVGQNWELIL